MKGLLVFIITGFQFLQLNAQNIVAAEYFIDTDPGPGNGTPVTLSVPSDTVLFSVSIPTSSLAPGFHLAVIRVKDANGTWGQMEKRGFYVTSTDSDASNITGAEYFFDMDPGPGNGISLTVGTPGSIVNFAAVIPVNLPAGFHFLAIRTKDASGNWGFLEKRGFYIDSVTGNLADITAAEYFIDNDPGIGNGTSIPISPPVGTYTDTLSLPFPLLPVGSYQIALRVRNSNGQWSLMENRPFAVCSTYGAQSEMSYQIEGNRVFFTNHSLFYDTVTWKFGDNTLDTVTHPVKTYTNAGTYIVQLIAGNSCGIDTLAETIDIRGLQRVNPGMAGNAGVSTLMFEGFGFSASTEVKLLLGSQVFLPVSKVVENSNRIRAHFNLTGYTPGIYRAVATLGSAFDTLDNALNITTAIPDSITMDVPNGRLPERTGRVKINGSVRNHSSHDAVMVPFVVAANALPGVSPANMNLFPSTLMVNLSTEGVFAETFQFLTNNGVPGEVMLANMFDSVRKRHILAYYRIRVPGQSTTREIVGLPHIGPAHSFQTGVVALKPLLDSYALMDSIHTNYEACYSAFLKREVEKQLQISVNVPAWNNCFASAFDTLMRTLANISQNPAYESYAVPLQAGFSALLARMAGCPGNGVPASLGGIQFKRIIQGLMNNWVYLEDVDSLDADCVDTSVKVFTRIIPQHISGNPVSNERIAGACGDCPGANIFPEMCDVCLPLIIAGKVGKKIKGLKRALGANSAIVGCQEWCEMTSMDPNIKLGPGNNDDRKYINHLKDVGYKISFENLASATAPAAYVEIRDTIDKNVFDISSFRLGVFSWGDSLVTADPNEQNVSFLKDLRPTHPNYLRIDASTDTSAGIVNWKFWTVDTVTLQLTTDPLQGFLPPNTNGVSGAGYVSYTISPRSNVTNGTVLKNKASIVFDENPPIITGEWEYRIDTLQPASAVNALPPVTHTQNFTVTWSGTDAHAGIDLFSVYVSVNDSAYRIWKHLTNLTSDIYQGQFGNTYKFFSIALDKATNYEDPPVNALNNPDAFTSVEIALPLNLLSFLANKSPDGTKVDLLWQTSGEQNVSHFELQRSPDGSTYQTLATVPAQNNMQGGVYRWQDPVPLPKINYYRLKMVDDDSTFRFSPVKIVRFITNDNILIFPTVTTDRVFVQSERLIDIELYNIWGLKLLSHQVRQNLSINLAGYPAGQYILRVPSEDRNYKIIKL